MMVRLATLAFAAVLSTSIAGCEKTGEKERNAEGVANRQAEEAQSEANDRAVAAQAEADRRIAEARASFEQVREDYRHSRQADLDKLNLTITDLEIKDRMATGKDKATLDNSLPTIAAQRDTFARDLNEVPMATPMAWDDTRARLDREWEALKTSVSEAP
jgi:hypothetical protein